ncbi:hypothetical protein GE061_001376 [Apolygus lucorum]|uniref:Uncharacterized protein n=1 Tax=Apolygus lucorum TaxID=248454 RepID=A0A8S9Y775_APOLU|nr:hypothetical protein GE061_001376 [Apolygus lucorum]
MTMSKRIILYYLAAVAFVWGLTALFMQYLRLNKVQDDAIYVVPSTTKEQRPSLKTVIWKEKSIYTQIMYAAVEEVEGPNEDWLVHEQCDMPSIPQNAIFLATNTLTVTTLLVRQALLKTVELYLGFTTLLTDPEVSHLIDKIFRVIKYTVDTNEELL